MFKLCKQIGWIGLLICTMSGTLALLQHLHESEALLRERIGAERQKERIYVATQQYPNAIRSLTSENAHLRASLRHIQRDVWLQQQELDHELSTSR